MASANAGIFVLKTIRSLELSFPGPFVPWTIHSQERINTADLSILEPFVPWTVHSLKHSFQVPGPFLLAADHSFICQQSSTWSTYKEGTA